MNKETGGPAFPTNTRIGANKDGTWIAETPAVDGMTLRDYFAAKAMQTYMMQEVWVDDVYKQAAKQSYKVADAMLKAREQ